MRALNEMWLKIGAALFVGIFAIWMFCKLQCLSNVPFYDGVKANAEIKLQKKTEPLAIHR